MKRTEIIGPALRTEIGITFSSGSVTRTLFRRARRSTSAARKAIFAFVRGTNTEFLTEIARTNAKAMFVARLRTFVIARIIRVTFLFGVQLLMIEQKLLMAALTSKRGEMRTTRTGAVARRQFFLFDRIFTVMGRFAVAIHFHFVRIGDRRRTVRRGLPVENAVDVLQRLAVLR